MNYMNELMKNLFSSGGGGSGKKSSESKLKEEEDPYKQKFDITFNKPNIVNNDEIIANGLEILLSDLINKYDPNLRELDYRYSSVTNDTELTNPSDIQKMKAIGKIYNDVNSKFSDFTSSAISSYNESRIEAYSNFPTTRSKNCFFKGKWAYEVRLITNNLFQIGWGKYNTTCTNTMGYGDDKESYAYDGYRLCFWNGEQMRSEKAWDCGDVLGCCIDLDNKFVEYFLNGKSLGVVNKDIRTGPNEAYFPGLTSSNKEKCIINTGEWKFEYEYISSVTKQ
jgi:hypothetical protein